MHCSSSPINLMIRNIVSLATGEEAAKLKRNKEQQAKGACFGNQRKRRSNNALIRNYRNMYFSLYESADDSRWYWSILANDNQIIAIGGEGYISKQDAYTSVNHLRESMPGFKVYDESRKEWLK